MGNKSFLSDYMNHNITHRWAPHANWKISKLSWDYYRIYTYIYKQNTRIFIPSSYCFSLKEKKNISTLLKWTNFFLVNLDRLRSFTAKISFLEGNTVTFSTWEASLFVKNLVVSYFSIWGVWVKQILTVRGVLEGAGGLAVAH